MNIIFRNKENGYIDPVGRLADHPVVRVKKDGDQSKSQKDTAQLYTPKILAVAKEKALNNSIEKHRPKKQFHMLEGRFIDPRKGRDPQSLSQPIV